MKKLFEEKILQQICQENSPQLKSWFFDLIWKRDFFMELFNSISIAILLINDKNKVVFHNEAAKKYIQLQSKWSKNSLVNVFDNCLFQDLKIALASLLDGSPNYDYVECSLFAQQVHDLMIKKFEFQAPLSELEEQENLKELYTWLESGKLDLILIMDITSLKNHSFKKNQEQSISSLQSLTAGIAHEIKNPLGALDLHLQLINRFIKKNQIENKPELEELVQIVNEEIVRLESIVNDFLFSFRPMKPIREPVILNEIITETIRFLKPKLVDKKIDFKLDLDTNVIPFLFDRNQIKQAIINLINNSVDAILENDSLDQGKINISTKELNQKLLLRIKDNGVGLDQKKMSEIFTPFYTTKKMGSGLGLSIVMKVVKEHDGEIILQNNRQNNHGVEKKTGAEFLIEFSRIKNKHRLLN